MKKAILLPLIALLFIVPFFAAAQAAEEEAEKYSLDSGTLNDRFDYVIEKSNRYQEYKVVKMAWLNALKSYVMDSMKAVRKDFSDAQNTIAAQKNDIASLQAELKNTRDTLATLNTEKNSIDFINVQMPKSAYKSMMWTITGGLFALLLFFIYKFKNSNVITTETQKTLAETREEFEAFRKRAREREQVLKRELQDEINKRA
ncbi:MAG TPA: hypothetical protein VNJ07_09375 [Chitinophagales bacterium]|nr:hypothetical protein [Chitinophagales bacterium]